MERRKKSEILQMGFLKPKLCILDEIDSGLDIDALRIVSESLNSFSTEEMGDFTYYPLSKDFKLRCSRFCSCLY